MAVDDIIIKNVGEFNDKNKTELKDRRRDYERAKQGAEHLPKYMEKLEESLKKEVKHPLGTKENETDVEKGNILFTIKSEQRTKKPSYKGMVEDMEKYVTGIVTLLSENRKISRIEKIDGKSFIMADDILLQYDIIVKSHLIGELKHTITYSGSPSKLESLSNPKEMTLRTNDYEYDGKLNEKNFEEYIMMDKLLPSLEAFVEAYESKLPNGASKKGVTKVNKTRGYAKESANVQGGDWKFVTSTLVQVYSKDDLGELNILADPNLSFAKKKKMLPDYGLVSTEKYGKERTFIELQSIYDRIQVLKMMDPKNYTREKYVPVEIL